MVVTKKVLDLKSLDMAMLLKLGAEKPCLIL